MKGLFKKKITFGINHHHHDKHSNRSDGDDAAEEKNEANAAAATATTAVSPPPAQNDENGLINGNNISNNTSSIADNTNNLAGTVRSQRLLQLEESTKSAAATTASGGVADETTSSGRRTSDNSEGCGTVNRGFDGIVIADLDGIITQVNDTTVKLFGYTSKTDLIGENLSILVGGGDETRHDAYVHSFKERMTSPHSHNPQHHKVLGRQRLLHARRLDGTEFPCIVGLKMVSNNTKVAGYIRDLSKVVPEKGGRSRRKNKSDMDIVNAVVEDRAFDAIIATDNRGIIQNVNDATLTEFGYTYKNELVGENISILLHIALWQLATEIEEKQRVAKLKKKDGEKEFRSIIVSRKIRGTAKVVFAIYIRNIDPVRSAIVDIAAS